MSVQISPQKAVIVFNYQEVLGPLWLAVIIRTLASVQTVHADTTISCHSVRRSFILIFLGQTTYSRSYNTPVPYDSVIWGYPSLQTLCMWGGGLCSNWEAYNEWMENVEVGEGGRHRRVWNGKHNETVRVSFRSRS